MNDLSLGMTDVGAPDINEGFAFVTSNGSTLPREREFAPIFLMQNG